MKKITEENRDDVYAALVKMTEEEQAKGQKLTRFKALNLLEELDIELDRDSVDLIEKLYADGFIAE